MTFRSLAKHRRHAQNLPGAAQLRGRTQPIHLSTLGKTAAHSDSVRNVSAIICECAVVTDCRAGSRSSFQLLREMGEDKDAAVSVSVGHKINLQIMSDSRGKDIGIEQRFDGHNPSSQESPSYKLSGSLSEVTAVMPGVPPAS